jgi:hypothetical protein
MRYSNTPYSAKIRKLRRRLRDHKYLPRIASRRGKWGDRP